MNDLWPVIARTLQVAAVATASVFVPATLLGYALARYSFPGKRALSALTTLPMVLPPTALGFLLLQLLAVDGPLGSRSLGFDPGILLTWRAAALASAAMSAPLIVRTARVSFEAVDPRLEMIARTLGHSRLRTFVAVSLPLARRGLCSAAILGFTRAVGEFGATVTLAGNIPGRTQTLSSAIFEAQQVGDTPRANALMWIALAIGFGCILAAEWLAGPPAPGAQKPQRP